MTISPRRLRAAFLSLAVPLAASLPIGPTGNAWAQGGSVEVPSHRQLGASEPMTSQGANGTDFSVNAPSLAGLTLLATIPAATAPRRGYLIQAQCTAGLTLAFDDGSATPTIIVLAGATTNGAQGGSLDMAGMPHAGRIRIYSSSSSCQMAARSW